MVSEAFWSKLAEADRKMMRDLWAANIARYRANAATSQAEARKTMEENGVTFVDPSADQVAADRKRMMRRRPT